MKKLYELRLNYLSNNIWKIEPCHNSLIGFSISEKEEKSIYSSILNIGVINEYDILADKCLIFRNEKERIYENEEFKFEIISYSKDGNEMRNGGNGDKFTIHIEEEPKIKKHENNHKNEWKIMDLNNGKYEVKMKLKNEGKYSVFIKFNGINNNSSPFQIQVSPKQRNYLEINEPKLTFGSKGNGNGQFNSSYGITTNSKGNVLLSDFNNNRIQIFNSEGNFISKFGTKGNGNGQFVHPVGITINSRGNMIVCDSSNDRIQIFDSEGKFISTFGSSGNGNGQFKNPEGICVDKNDKIYVCEWENNRVQIFDSDGKFISTFGSEGNGNGQFNGPVGIIVNSKGNIIVCECSGNRIQIFDTEGKFISKFRSEGSGNGEFNNPFGGCVDLNDNIFVCDRNNNRIQIFDSNGKYMVKFKVVRPTNITIDPNTQNIIVSQYDHQVSIFDSMTQQ